MESLAQISVEAGEVLKTGRLLVFKEQEQGWYPCKVALTLTSLKCVEVGQQGSMIELVLADTDEVVAEMHMGTSPLIVVDPVVMEILPDYARRSKHSKLHTFSVQAEGGKLVLAAANGVEMWGWCRAIRRRGRGSVSAESARGLGRRLLWVCTAHKESGSRLSRREEVQELLLQGATVKIDEVGEISEYGEETIDYSPAMWAAVRTRGAAREQIIELLLSAGVDINHTSRLGENIMLLLCFSHYDPARSALLESLIERRVSPHVTSEHWHGNIINYLIKMNTESAGVHPQEKELAVRLVGMGVGRENNEKAKAAARKAAGIKTTELMLQAVGSKWDATKGYQMTGDGMTQIPAEVITSKFGTSLVRLDLSNNTIVDLPSSLFELANLAVLNLSSNCLTHLSPSVRKLTKLTRLVLSGNRLTELPVEMGDLNSLEYLELGNSLEYLELGPSSRREGVSGNPIVNPPPEIWMPRIHEEGEGEHTTRRVLGFLKELEQGSVENWELKLPVVGLSEVGKTSLINAIVESKSRLVRVGDRTVGVEQRVWNPLLFLFGDGDAFLFTADIESNADGGICWDDNNAIQQAINALKARDRERMMEERASKEARSDAKQEEEEERSWIFFEEEPPWIHQLAAMRVKSVRGEASRLGINPGSTLMAVNGEAVKQGMSVPEFALFWHTLKRPFTLHFSRPQALQLRIFDFAGQREYYLTHHMFLTRRALYIVAFDINKYRPQHFQSMIMFFISKLQSRVPAAPVILVGTHADKVSEEDSRERCKHVLDVLVAKQRRESRRLNAKMELLEAEIEHGVNSSGVNTTLEKKLKDLREQLQRFVVLPKKVHAVSSGESMQNIAELKEAIAVTATDKELFPQLGEQIPRIYEQIRTCIREWRVRKPYCGQAELVEMLMKEDLEKNINYERRKEIDAQLEEHTKDRAAVQSELVVCAERAQSGALLQEQLHSARETLQQQEQEQERLIETETIGLALHQEIHDQVYFAVRFDDDDTYDAVPVQHIRASDDGPLQIGSRIAVTWAGLYAGADHPAVVTGGPSRGEQERARLENELDLLREKERAVKSQQEQLDAQEEEERRKKWQCSSRGGLSLIMSLFQLRDGKSLIQSLLQLRNGESVGGKVSLCEISCLLHQLNMDGESLMIKILPQLRETLEKITAQKIKTASEITALKQSVLAHEDLWSRKEQAGGGGRGLCCRSSWSRSGKLQARGPSPDISRQGS
jgi:GTPase SAR1 family protein